MAIKEQESVKFTPGIFIGIGGSGSRVVSTIRKKAVRILKRDYPKIYNDVIDNIFQFVAIDSVPDAKASQLQIPQSNYRKFGGFDGTLEVETQSKINAARFNKWWLHPYPSMLLEKGAGMIRINGRLCFLKDVENVPNIATCIRDACRKVAGINKKWVAAEGKGQFAVNIYIFCSLSGGTGSGIFIDLAWFIRRELDKSYLPRLDAYLLTPDAVMLVAPASSENQVFGNGYAALRELDFWQNPNRGRAYAWEGLPDSGGTLRKIDRPFDLVHLIHPINETGKAINDWETIHRLIADLCFYDALIPQSKNQTNEPRHNVYAKFDKTSGVFKQKYPVMYGSGGISMLRVPIDKVLNYLSAAVLPDLLRSTVMKEPEQAATQEADEFWKVNLNPDGLRKRIQENPDFPRKVSKNTLIDSAGRKGLAAATKKYHDTVKKYTSNLIGLLAGEDGEQGLAKQLKEEFNRELNKWVTNVLGKLRDDSIGLLSGAVDRLLSKIKGQIHSDDENQGSLISRYNNAKVLKKKAEDAVDKAYHDAYDAGVFRRKERKEVLKKAFSDLYRAIDDLVLTQHIVAIEKGCLERLSVLRACLKYLRSQVIHPLYSDLEGAKEAVWTNLEYDDEQGGIVIEVLDRDWADQALKTMSKDRDFLATCHEALSAAILEMCRKETMNIWRKVQSDQENVKSLMAGHEARSTRSKIKKGLSEAAIDIFQKEINESYAGLDIWEALKQEAMAHHGIAAEEAKEKKDQIKLYITDRLSTWQARANVWWPIPDTHRTGQGLLKAEKMTSMGILRCNVKAAKRFEEEYSLDVKDTLGLVQNLELSENNDPHCLQFVQYKYGAPLFLFGPIKSYRRRYDVLNENCPEIPLHVDLRYIKAWDLPWPDEDIDVGSKNVVKILFNLLEYITLPDEKCPQIIKKRSQYTFCVQGMPDISVSGRSDAQNAFRHDSFKDGKKRLEQLRNALVQHWDKQSVKYKKEQLEAVKKKLDNWIKRAGPPKENEKSLPNVLHEDYTVIEELLKSGEHAID